MNYPYPSFFLDVQLAKRRLAQILATGGGVPGNDLFPPSSIISQELSEMNVPDYLPSASELLSSESQEK
jgi:hypothetical protein